MRPATSGSPCTALGTGPTCSAALWHSPTPASVGRGAGAVPLAATASTKSVSACARRPMPRTPVSREGPQSTTADASAAAPRARESIERASPRAGAASG
jgi:hypothetical protein